MLQRKPQWRQQKTSPTFRLDKKYWRISSPSSRRTFRQRKSVRQCQGMLRSGNTQKKNNQEKRSMRRNCRITTNSWAHLVTAPAAKLWYPSESVSGSVAELGCCPGKVWLNLLCREKFVWAKQSSLLCKFPLLNCFQEFYLFMSRFLSFREFRFLYHWLGVEQVFYFLSYP